MSAPVRGALFLVASLLLAGCSPAPQPPGAPASRTRQQLQGAVLFLLDTVRADHVTCYGYARPTTSALARIAEQGVVFEKVIASAPWTLPSVQTILSAQGLDRAATAEHKLSASVVESIRRAGYATGAATEGGFVSKAFGFDRGFDEYYEEEGAVQLVRPDKPRNPNPSGGIDRTFAKAREWLGKHRNEKFFLLVHTYEPHAPHDRPTFTPGLPVPRFGPIFTIETGALLRAGRIPFGEAELRYLEALYDGGVHEADRHVGAFLDFLGEVGLADRTLVAVTSDHGEELGDHYPAFSGNHGHSLHDELLLVPLVLHDPTNDYPVRRVRSQVRTIDILPTIAEILGAPVEYPADGASLVPVLLGKETEGRIASGGGTKYGPEQVFVRHGGYKLIRVTDPSPKREPVLPPPPPVQLYDLVRDPRERTNLAQPRPEIVRQMERLLEAARATGKVGDALPPPEEMDPELRERLRSLGYLK